jgi:CRP-like cAMP-binding protein
VPEHGDIVESLAGLALFADLPRPQLEAVTHTFEEEWISEGQRVLRQGIGGSNFYLILEGEAVVRINGEDRRTMGRGDFFGEVSILLSEPPSADVVALRPLHCLVLPASGVTEFLTTYPWVAFRMLQAEARRLRTASQWHS